jgi:hypothetical protein
LFLVKANDFPVKGNNFLSKETISCQKNKFLSKEYIPFQGNNLLSKDIISCQMK